MKINISILMFFILISCNRNNVEPTLSEQEVLELLNTELLNGEGEITINGNEVMQLNDNVSMKRFNNTEKYKIVAKSQINKNAGGATSHFVLLQIDTPPLTNGTYSMNEVGVLLLYLKSTYDASDNFIGGCTYYNFNLSQGTITFIYKKGEVLITFDTPISDGVNKCDSSGITHLSGTVTGRL